jgi:hypothetical protein
MTREVYSTGHEQRDQNDSEPWFERGNIFLYMSHESKYDTAFRDRRICDYVTRVILFPLRHKKQYRRTREHAKGGPGRSSTDTSRNREITADVTDGIPTYVFMLGPLKTCWSRRPVTCMDRHVQRNIALSRWYSMCSVSKACMYTNDRDGSTCVAML